MTQRHPIVHAVVVDLDNTLYDWVAYFVPAMRAMLVHAAQQLGTDERSIRADLRTVHMRRGNTEHPFALLETDAVVQRLPGHSARERYEILRPAFEAFNRARARHLHLYPMVKSTLDTIRATGCRILGHTEATDVNAATRVRALGLHHLLDTIYASEFVGPPHPLGMDRKRSGERVAVAALPRGSRKPDPTIARQIVRQVGIPAERCLYVGDSLRKDVAMAKAAGMLAAWARYGTRHDAQLWAELVELSHWDAATVADAEQSSVAIEPDVVLDSFDELLSRFTFAAAPRVTRERRRHQQAIQGE